MPLLGQTIRTRGGRFGRSDLIQRQEELGAILEHDGFRCDVVMSDRELQSALENVSRPRVGRLSRIQNTEVVEYPQCGVRLLFLLERRQGEAEVRDRLVGAA